MKNTVNNNDITPIEYIEIILYLLNSLYAHEIKTNPINNDSLEKYIVLIILLLNGNNFNQYNILITRYPIMV